MATKTKMEKIQKRIKSETLYRDFTFKREHINEEDRTVELAFSSDAPYRRWFGDEILDHGKDSIRLGRLEDGGPVLVDHDPRDHVGVIEVVKIDGSTGRAVVRFGRSERANEIFNDIVDGIRSKVSVGYIVHKMVLEEGGSDDAEVYRVTDWEPIEVSMVSIPADAGVGVGRDLNGDLEPDEEKAAAKPAAKPEPIIEVTPMETPEEKAARLEKQRKAEQAAIEGARSAEVKRCAEINAAVEQHPQLKELAAVAIREGKPLSDFRADALKELHNAKELNTNDLPAQLGMEEKQIKQYSMFRAIRAAADKDWSDAGLEREVHVALQEKRSEKAKGFLVPYDVLSRDLTVGTDTAGGHLVATDHMAGSFIEMLRNKALITSLGAQVIDGLVGNVDIPSQTGGATFYWVTEGGTTTESNPTFGNLALTPKTVSGRVDLSRRLVMQSSPAAEMLIRNDLALGTALAIDLAGINGSGASGQPTGILNTSGIGDVAGGTNGLAPAWSHIVDLESDVSVANADIGSLAYLTSAAVRGKLKKTEMFSGSNGLPVWERGAEPLNGYNAGVSNQVPDNLTKGTSSGVCSAIIFGNFNDLIIGMWGGLDIKVDDVTLGDSGGLVVRVFQDIDVGVRHAASFSAMQDALTA